MKRNANGEVEQGYFRMLSKKSWAALKQASGCRYFEIPREVVCGASKT